MFFSGSSAGRAVWSGVEGRRLVRIGFKGLRLESLVGITLNEMNEIMELVPGLACSACHSLPTLSNTS